MLKVGIVGMGMMGWLHAAQYSRLAGVELVAIADLLPERLEVKNAVTGNISEGERAVDFSKISRFAEGSDLIAQAGVDIVDICLPTDKHADYAIEALQAGHHVLCEKPMALSLADADRMIAAAEQTGRLLMIAQCIRFWPEYQFLRDTVRSGTLGALLSLNLIRIGATPGWSARSWFTDPARSGGPIYDLHIHDVDFVNYPLGVPDRIQATARKSAPTGAYDVIHAQFLYDDGPQVQIHGGWSVAQIPFVAGYDAWFEKGFIRFDGRQDPALMVFDDSAESWEPAYHKESAYFNEIAYFAACVGKDVCVSECGPDSARASLALVEREIVSIETGQTVERRG